MGENGLPNTALPGAEKLGAARLLDIREAKRRTRILGSTLGVEEMFVFVAHTDVDKEFALETAQRIREAGHDAFAGEQIYQGFTAMSFAHPDIAKALRAADALVAFGLDWDVA